MTAPTADLALVRRVIEETGVDQTASAPGWSGYVQALTEAFARWMVGWLGGLSSIVVTSLGPVAAVLLAAVVVSILCILLWRAVLRRRRPRVRRDAAAPSLPLAPAGSERDRDAWRTETERRLAASDVSGALEALWWWFARSVSGGQVDPSWTSHEMLARCGRPDLTPLARVLDGLLYGSERPRVEDVRRFLGRMEVVLP